MVTACQTVAFAGIDPLLVSVQAVITGGLPAFTIVGLPDKAVGESRERVRSALHAIGLALPPKRITINLAPADLLKEGSHFDLPIALALLGAMGVIPPEDLHGHIALGELGLDGGIASVAGVLPAAMAAVAHGYGIICPAARGGEAAWASSDRDQLPVLAAPNLIAIVNHFKGTQVLIRPQAEIAREDNTPPDLADIKGQETAKRALEIAAAGGHNLLLIGPPGTGKSMLAARLPGLLPPLAPEEALQTSMIHSVAGLLKEGRLLHGRPFRDPHHSASLPALVGGGIRARPGEVSLAHGGVLFLDELPEFHRASLEALRQPLESGRAVIARANHHVSYPARVQLIAAMNPCRCGYLGDPERSCRRVPLCARDYQSKISGPLLDRIDLVMDVDAVAPADLARAPTGEPSRQVAARVVGARARQAARLAAIQAPGQPRIRVNAAADGTVLERITQRTPAADHLLREAAERMNLSARGYHRVLRVARTITDLDPKTDPAAPIEAEAIAEALSYRRRMGV